VRYLTDGVVLGRRGFVDAAFQRHRGYFSEKRRDGARAMRGAQWGGLFTARDLRKRDYWSVPVVAVAAWSLRNTPNTPNTPNIGLSISNLV